MQQKGRHRKIETTLRYDHASDDIVREYFEKHQIKSDKIGFNADSIEKPEEGIGYM